MNVHDDEKCMGSMRANVNMNNNNAPTHPAALGTDDGMNVGAKEAPDRRKCLTFKKEVELRTLNKVPQSVEGWDRFKFEYRAELAMVHLLGVLDSEGDEYTPDELRVVAGNLIGRLHSNVAILDRVRTLPTHIVEGTREDLGLPHPYCIWKVIQDEFQKVTTPHMFQLMAELRAVRMKGNFADFKAQIDLLCVKLATLGYIVRDEEKVCTLLLGFPEDAETRLVTLNIEYRRLGFSAACAELEVHFNRKEGWSKISKKKGSSGEVLAVEEEGGHGPI